MTDETTQETPVSAEAVVSNPTESPVGTTATAAVTSPTATPQEENSTPEPVAAAPNVAGSLDEVRKDAENEVHPIVKHWWETFEGDAKAILVFVESELKKLV